MSHARKSSPGVQLIIAEKPSVARDIARVVGARSKHTGYLEGPGVRVSWCVGHLTELCEPHEYDAKWKSWSLAHLPILPEPFQVRATSSGRAQLGILQRLMNTGDVGSIVNACDAGREGELIFRRVYQVARCAKPVQRLWISSLTESAIRRGLANLQPSSAFDNLADAAAARAEADWLVGMNATRALTGLMRKGNRQATLMSVGRVQTPTLAMIVRREDEIEAFQKTSYWQVEARFSWPGAPPGEPGGYTGLWHADKDTADREHVDKEHADRLLDVGRARAIADAVANRPGRVLDVQNKTVREKPPLLFDLTSLQKAANRRFGMSAKRTLAAAQGLYESHKAITYPRTDSRHLTSDMAPGLPDVLASLRTPPYDALAADALARGVPPGRRMIDDSEVGDHHAIIPTGTLPRSDKLGADEARVLDLIIRRFLAGFLEDAVFAKTRIRTLVAEQLFISDGRVRVQLGWQAAEPPARERKTKKSARAEHPDDDAGGSDKVLPQIPRGAAVHTDKATVHERETQPPKRHTEATLLAAMEHAGRDITEAALRRVMKDMGLGTPATRAAIIETLIKRQYIERQGRSLHPTGKGRALIAALPVAELSSAELTGTWEQKLAFIARAELTRARFMHEIRSFTTQMVETMAAASPPENADMATDAPAEVLGVCPVCATPVREGRRAYQCATGKSCSFVIFKRVAGRTISPALVQVLLGRRRSQVLKGFRSKRGKRFSAALALSDEGKVELVFGETPANGRTASTTQGDRSSSKPTKTPKTDKPTKTDKPPRCPLCKAGRIIAGRRGWGCSRWRESCGFVVWFEQRGTRVPDDEAERLFRRGQTRLMSGLAPEGKARLVLDLDADGNVRVELSKRAQP